MPARIAVCFLLPMPLVIAAAAEARAAPPQSHAGVWQSDFEAAQAEADRLGRPMVIHFSAPWCGACRRMELQVLPHPDVSRQLAAFFVAVRVDTDARPDLAQRFGIRSLPTDLIVAPDGTVLARSEQALDQHRYLRQLAQAERRWAAIERRRDESTMPSTLAGESRPVPAATDPADPPAPPSRGSASAGDGAAPRALPGEPAVAPVDRHSATAGSAVGEPNSVELRTLEATVALDGYCPVTLAETYTWVDGDARYSVRLDGRLYVFAGAEERDRFLADPTAYVPWNDGHDPVLLLDYEYEAPGSPAYGAYYEGQLYLFANETTRQLFRDSPERYATRTQTAAWQ